MKTASWKVGVDPGYEAEPPPFVAAPMGSMNKYRYVMCLALVRPVCHPLTPCSHPSWLCHACRDMPAIRWTHNLLSVTWMLPLPLQLSPSLRWRYPALHRAGGRLVLLGALLVVVGYALMEAAGEAGGNDATRGNTTATYQRPFLSTAVAA